MGLALLGQKSRVRILAITNWNYSGIFIVVVRDRVDGILNWGGYMAVDRFNPNPLGSLILRPRKVSMMSDY